MDCRFLPVWFWVSTTENGGCSDDRKVSTETILWNLRGSFNRFDATDHGDGFLESLFDPHFKGQC
jgi:hypothetical protein